MLAGWWAARWPRLSRGQRLWLWGALSGCGLTLAGWAQWPLTSYCPFGFVWICLPLEFGILCALMVRAPKRVNLAVAAMLFTILPCLVALRYLSPVRTGTPMCSYLQYGPPLGYQPKPWAEADALKTCRGKTLYRVRYRFDEFGRRRNLRPSGAKKALLCFGCSFTFGEGVEEDQAWPAQLAARHSEVAVYNYGFSGWSPAQMLDAASLRDLRHEVPEPQAQATFLLLNSHLDRINGSWFMVGGWGGASSRYVLDGAGVLRSGTMSDHLKPWEFIACHSLGGFGLFRWMKPRQLADAREAEKELLVRILGESQRQLNRQFGSCPLTVFTKVSWHQELANRLRPYGVRTCLYPAGLSSIPQDGHPDADGHRRLSQCVEEALWGRASRPSGRN